MKKYRSIINKKLKHQSTTTTGKTKKVKRLFIAVTFTILLTLIPSLGRIGTYNAIAQSPTPTPDRLAEPALPETPNQYEQGRHSYWLNCMPCHGDYGQGLTDEFRGIWVEDHQNCWAHGCHGGGIDDEGFAIPKYIPAVISTSNQTVKYTKSGELYEYLNTTHPPQNPGYLPEDDYWALTAYVMTENNLLPLDQEIGPQAETTEKGNTLVIAVIGSIILGIIIVWIKKVRKTMIPPSL